MYRAIFSNLGYMKDRINAKNLCTHTGRSIVMAILLSVGSNISYKHTFKNMFCTNHTFKSFFLI